MSYCFICPIKQHPMFVLYKVQQAPALILVTTDFLISSSHDFIRDVLPRKGRKVHLQYIYWFFIDIIRFMVFIPKNKRARSDNI